MSGWSVGTQLGPYELTSQIGAGGMGEEPRARLLSQRRAGPAYPRG